jgi:hypothetical protein
MSEYLKGKIRFKNPKIKECIGQAEAESCLKCVRNNPGLALGCKRLGDFLDRNTWNRVIGTGPLYQNDYKAREETVSPDAKGNEIILDKFGKQKIFTGRKVA